MKLTILALLIASTTIAGASTNEVSSLDELRAGVQEAVDGTVFKISSSAPRFEQDTLGIPADKNVVIDLNGINIPIHVSVLGELKVIDTNPSKSGCISGQIDASDGKIVFDIDNTVAISNCWELSNLAASTALGAKYKLVLGQGLEDDMTSSMEVPKGGHIVVDFNGNGIMESIVVRDGGYLKLENNMVAAEFGIDLMAGGIGVEEGAVVEGSTIRTLYDWGWPWFNRLFDESIALVKAGATVIAFLETDIEDSFEVPEGKYLAVNLYGHTLSGKISVNGTLQVFDSYAEEPGSIQSELVVGANGKVVHQNLMPVSTFDKLTSALTSSYDKLTIMPMTDLSGSSLMIPVGKDRTISLNGHNIICEDLTVLGDLTVEDTVGTTGYIKAPTIKLGRKGSFTIGYGPIRGTFDYLNPGMMMILK